MEEEENKNSKSGNFFFYKSKRNVGQHWYSVKQIDLSIKYCFKYANKIKCKQIKIFAFNIYD